MPAGADAVTSTELVGPVRTMRMRDGSRLTDDTPPHTRDPRKGWL